MGINFEATITEADFTRPLLDAAEEQLARQVRGETDLHVEGLRDTLLSRLMGLFVGGSRRAS
jgi:hypothetical protein